MKKVIAVSLIVLVILTVSVSLFACSPKNTALEVTGIVASVSPSAVFKVGEAFDTSKIIVKAQLSDKTERLVSTTVALEFDLKNLELDANNKLTKAGKFEIGVTFSKYSTKVSVNIIE